MKVEVKANAISTSHLSLWTTKLPTRQNVPPYVRSDPSSSLFPKRVTNGEELAPITLHPNVTATFIPHPLSSRCLATSFR